MSATNKLQETGGGVSHRAGVHLVNSLHTASYTQCHIQREQRLILKLPVEAMGTTWPPLGSQYTTSVVTRYGRSSPAACSPGSSTRT